MTAVSSSSGQVLVGRAGGPAKLHRSGEQVLGSLVAHAPDGDLGRPIECVGGPPADADRHRGPEVLGQDLGHVVGVAAGLDDRIGHGEVHPGPPEARHVVEDHLAHEGVGEAHHARTVRVGDQEPVDERRLDVGEALVDRDARGSGPGGTGRGRGR